MIQLKQITTCIFLSLFSFSFSQTQQKSVEKWGIYEIDLESPQTGNPFVGINLTAKFTNGCQTFSPEGFYDGNNTYKIRFMPNKEGVWTYKTKSNRKELDGKMGEFTCTTPAKNSHGPVRIRNQYHFEYQDKIPYFPFGTTIYEWVFQTDSIRKQTLTTLQSSPYNKVRFLLIPPYKEKYLEGALKVTDFPFKGTSIDNFDFSRFNVKYFQNFDKCLKQIEELGIEADIILFRPYDGEKWGFDRMDNETNNRLIRYVVARLAAYRNVWWCLANENSFMRHFKTSDWDRLFQIISHYDPYHHLLSIHNADILYDYSKSWVTHVSLQYYNAVRALGASVIVRDIYQKPVIYDEINYEGNSPNRWGQLSGNEMTYRFWLAYTGGTYATHGEIFDNKQGIDWISDGGTLHGTSTSRIAFLRKIIESGPKEGMEPIDHTFNRNIAGKSGEYYLFYFGKDAIKHWNFELPADNLVEGMKFKVELIDTWNMTITPVSDIFQIKKLNRYLFIDKLQSSIKFPGRPYMAMRITLIK